MSALDVGFNEVYRSSKPKYSRAEDHCPKAEIRVFEDYCVKESPDNGG